MALLDNTSEKEGRFIKQVALDPTTMEPRRVLKVIRPRLNLKGSTQQEVKKDDLVVRFNVKPSLGIEVFLVERVINNQVFMSKFTGKTLDMLDKDIGIKWFKLFSTMSPELLKWLDNTDDARFLPAGIGWDGKRTRYEQVKHDEFNELLKDVNFSTKAKFISYAMVSPRANVNTKWSTAQQVPTGGVYLPHHPKAVSHFVITFDESGHTRYNEYACKSDPLTIDLFKNTHLSRAIVGSIIKNNYGKQLHWKLYTV